MVRAAPKRLRDGIVVLHRAGDLRSHPGSIPFVGHQVFEITAILVQLRLRCA
jgi:hypothetical protein